MVVSSILINFHSGFGGRIVLLSGQFWSCSEGAFLGIQSIRSLKSIENPGRFFMCSTGTTFGSKSWTVFHVESGQGRSYSKKDSLGAINHDVSGRYSSRPTIMKSSIAFQPFKQMYRGRSWKGLCLSMRYPKPVLANLTGR